MRSAFVCAFAISLSACLPGLSRFSIGGEGDAGSVDASPTDASTDISVDISVDTGSGQTTHPSCQVAVTCSEGCRTPHLFAVAERFDSDCPGSLIQYSIADGGFCSCGNVDVALPNGLTPHYLQPISPTQVAVLSEDIVNVYDTEREETVWFWNSPSGAWFTSVANFDAAPDELVALGLGVPYYTRHRRSGAESRQLQLSTTGRLYADPWNAETLMLMGDAPGERCQFGCLRRYSVRNTGALALEPLSPRVLIGDGSVGEPRFFGRHIAIAQFRSFDTYELPESPPSEPIPIAVFQRQECPACDVEAVFPDGEGGAYHLCRSEGDRNEREIFHNCEPLSAAGLSGLNWGFTNLAIAP